MRQRRVCIADGYWSCAVQLELPTVSTAEEPIPRLAAAGFYLRINAMANATQSMLKAMKLSVRNTVDRILDLVPDINPRSPGRARTSRGLFDFIGKTQSFLFGTATEGDVESMKKLIEDVETMAETATADAARTREGLVTFTKIQEERMTNFRRVLEEEHKTVEAMYREIRAATDDEQWELNAVAYAMQALARYVALHDDLLHLLAGIEDLVHGQLTPRLIEMDQVQRIFMNVTRTLQREGKELCPTSAAEIYTSGTYEFARKGQSLFVHIKLPYTVKPRMDIFRTEVFAIPIPGEQQLTTKLKDIPNYIVMSEGSNLVGELQNDPKVPVVYDAEVTWHPKQRRTCLAAIRADDAQAISTQCDFTVRKGELTAKYVKIAERKYIVSNLTTVHAACRGAPYEPLSTEECVPCLVTLGCSCSLTAGEIEITAERPSCDNYTSRVEVAHATNLAALQAFYELTNETLSGAQLSEPREVKALQPIKLPFFGETTKTLLAADEAAGYSLKKLTESLQNDTNILHSPAEAIIRDMLKQNAALRRFELLSWSTWLTILPWVAVALLAAVQVRTFLKVRALTLAVATVGYARIPKIGAYVLRTEPTTTTETPIWLEAIADIRREDAGFVVYLILLTAVTIGLIVAVKRALSRRSFIYIDVESSHGIVQIKFRALPDSTRNFAVAVSKRPTLLTCKSFGIIGIIRFTSKPWKLVYEHNRQEIVLPTYIVLPFWKFRKVRKALSDVNSRITPLVIHSHEYVYHKAKGEAPTGNPPRYSEARV